MRRRDFCRLLAATTAAKALPGLGQAAQQNQQSAMPDGFNQLTRDYAQFCGLPPDERVYYTLSGNQIVPTKLDNATWRPTGMGNPPQLPVPGGSWDGVPMQSPIAGLEGEGP